MKTKILKVYNYLSLCLLCYIECYDDPAILYTELNQLSCNVGKMCDGIMKNNKLFTNFLSKFPEVDLPVTVSDESKMIFSSSNTPLTSEEVRNFISMYEVSNVDEYTEYVPCFRLKNTGNIHVIVYWKAGLLTYHYYIATYNKNGVQLAKQKIAGVVTHGEKITQAVANIEEDWIIYVVQNSMNAQKEIDDESTKAFSLEVLADGQIIFSLNEDIF